VVTRGPAQTSSGRLDPAATVGAVALTVADLERSRRFYTSVLGMHELGVGTDGSLTLGGPDGAELLVLSGDPAAPPRNPRQTGLFHFAVLVPSRFDLARALLGLVNARWPLAGASDHLVSEALYLSDPDGNGIEIYRDRPRTEWRRDPDGTIAMATLALDLDDLVGELDSQQGRAGSEPPPVGLAAGTRMGHVHLQVAALPEVEAFYAGVLGFDVMVRGYPGALFVAAGGYHHHIGLNTWNSRGGATPAPGTVGLAWFQVRTGSEARLDAVLDRLRGAGVEPEPVSDGWLVADPSGNRVRLAA
jgi:catechol 2,3-dioxygenase